MQVGVREFSRAAESEKGSGPPPPERRGSHPSEKGIGTSGTVPAKAMDARAGKYLAFLLGREEFAIAVLKVREIMGIQEITAVPHTQAYVKGVINLRGKVIPVVDLRLKFSLPEREYTQRTCIIVVQAQNGNISIPTGIVVDAVSEVLNLSAADIEDTPDFGGGGDAAGSYLLGMAKVKGKVKILLDIDRVLAGHEIQGLEALAQI